MHQRIENLLSGLPGIVESWNAVVVRWKEGGLPEDKAYSRIHGATFHEFNLRVVTTLETVDSLGRVSEAGQLLFLPRVDGARQQLTNAKQQIDGLLSQLNGHPGSTLNDVQGSLDSVQVIVSGTAITSVNLGAYLEQIGASMASLFELASLGLRFGKAKGMSAFHKYVELLQQTDAELQSLLSKAREAHSHGADFVRTLDALQVRGTGLVGGMEEACTTSNNFLGEVKAAQDEAAAKLATIRETATKAASLDTQVRGYESSFDAFQKSLDDRVEQHGEFEKAMTAALAANAGREAKIDDLIAQSDSMIKGSTTAGLGVSLEETRKLYQERMVSTRRYFIASIVLLGASAIPLVAHILPGLFSSWLTAASTTGAGTAVSDTNAFLSLLGKVCLMFPATWLTQFFSKSYSEFFHLEREYAHKAALARSVEGFKRQAPKYQEEITAAVFAEIRENPSKQSAPEAAEHPLMGLLGKKLLDAMPLGDKK
jgi:hypothetical protein